MADEKEGGSGGLLPFLGNLAMSAGSAITKGGPKRQYKYNKKLMKVQNKMNRENAEWVLAQNRILSQEQREYDSPAQQMARLKAAGLNPFLAYNNGYVGNMNSPVTMGSLPAADMGQVDASYPDVAGDFMRAKLANTQVGLTEAKTSESAARSELIEVQTDIAKTNPMLDPKVATSVAEGMEATARAKRIEMDLTWFRKSHDQDYSIGYRKIRADVEQMEQRLGLNTEDLKIKNKILESKEYENAIKEIQKKWLQDGEITPEHIRQGLMMFLSRMAN